MIAEVFQNKNFRDGPFNKYQQGVPSPHWASRVSKQRFLPNKNPDRRRSAKARSVPAQITSGLGIGGLLVGGLAAIIVLRDLSRRG